MQFQIASDLHIEEKGGLKAPVSAYPKAKSPMLLLAGDTYPFAAADYKEIMRRVAEPFQLVLMIPGNHEYYGSNLPMMKTNVLMRERCNSISNVVYMNKASLKIGDTTFMGATCWTKIPMNLWESSKTYINDYNHIASLTRSDSNITPKEISSVHADHVRWLKKTIGEAKKTSKNAVVITHHAPTMQLSSENHSRTASLFPYYFATDMEDFIYDPFIKVWVYGHTHESHKIRPYPWGPVFACNARGYSFEKDSEYSDDAIISF